MHAVGGNTAQAIVTAEFENDKGRGERFQGLDNAGRAPLGCFTANAGVNHAMFVPLLFKAQLQQCGPGLVNVYTVTGAEAVADNQDGWFLRAACAGAKKQDKKGN